MIKNALISLTRRIVSKLKNRPRSELSKGIVIEDDSIIFSFKNGLICGKKFLIVEAVPTIFNASDVEELQHIFKSYYNALNLGFPVEVKTFLHPIDSDSYIRSIDRKIENLSVILELNPSASSIKTRLTNLNKIKHNVLKHGLAPYEVLTYFSVSACSEDKEELIRTLNLRLKALRDSLNSLGVKTKVVSLKNLDVVNKLFFRHTLRGDVLRFKSYKPMVLCDYSLFYFIPSLIRVEEFSNVTFEGVYLGIDVLSGRKVFWNVNKAPSPHILVVGPTGSGKTEFLSIYSYRFLEWCKGNVLIFDVKGEYRFRLERLGANLKELILGEDVGLGISELLNALPQNSKLNFMMDLLIDLVSSESISKDDVTAIYRSLNQVLSGKLRGSTVDVTELLDDVVNYLTNFEDPYLGYKISRALGVIKTLERGKALITLLGGKGSIYVLNFSKLMALGLNYVFITSSIISKLMRTYMSLMRRAVRNPVIDLLLVYDESWTVLPSVNINELVRLSRSYGISVALASQKLSDFKVGESVLVLNSGLLVAMPSANIDYWKELSKFMLINDDDVKRYALLVDRGEAVVRIAPHPRPYVIMFNV